MYRTLGFSRNVVSPYPYPCILDPTSAIKEHILRSLYDLRLDVSLGRQSFNVKLLISQFLSLWFVFFEMGLYTTSVSISFPLSIKFLLIKKEKEKKRHYFINPFSRCIEWNYQKWQHSSYVLIGTIPTSCFATWHAISKNQ